MLSNPRFRPLSVLRGWSFALGANRKFTPPFKAKLMQSGAQLRQTLGGTMGRKTPKAFSGRIWPNGNFSMGLGPSHLEAWENSCDVQDNQARWGMAGDISAAVSTLTSSNAPNSHTDDSALPQRGLKGITSRGQQMLRSACYILERDYGKDDLCFATLTVPKLSQPARVRLAGNWSELTRQFLQWVSRRLMSAGRPTKVCGCVEIQTARLQSQSEAYLHLHAVWPSHSNTAGRRWAVEWEDLRAWWNQALIRFSGEHPQYMPRVEVAPVKRSAERYMGKYLSKGSGEALEGFIADLGAESVPPTWWFMTADMRHQVKAETACGANTGTLLNAFIQQCFNEGDMSPFEWIRHVELPSDGKAVTIGWCGRIRPQWRDDLLSMLAPLIIPELSDLTGSL